MKKNVLEMKGIMKVYPNGVIANKSIDFCVEEGEIHALLGENGAGKSTLMKILYGVERPQEGSISIYGKSVSFHSSRDAIKQGIGMVHQHFMLVPSLTIAENIILGDEVVGGGIFLKRKEINSQIEALAKKYNFEININEQIRDVKVVIKQKVEILKVLYKGAKIIILDEPTAILTPQETKELFKELKILKQNGHTIIFITHKLDEVKEICDRLSIMNHGKMVGTYNVEDLSVKEISNLMVGREIKEEYQASKYNSEEILLEVDKLSIKNTFGKHVVNGASLTLKKGEILSVIGVEGNGQSEFIQAITGLRSYSQGMIRLEGQSIKGMQPKAIRALKVAHIPEDRMTVGIAPEMSIEENLFTHVIDQTHYSKRGIMQKGQIGQLADELIKKYSIRCSGRKQAVEMLSGGNIQKVVVARELNDNPNVIIANHPTRGIDIGAAEFIRTELMKRRDEGAGIILVTADLNECFQISDRIVVMYKGEITGILENNKELNELILGEYMLGLRKDNQKEVD